MEWSACSPDMNPIEHVWDALGRRVAGRQPPPQTLQELERALLEEWDRIPQLVINSLIDSLPQREHPSQTDNQRIFFMPYNHTTWPLSIFCIRKIHHLGPGSNPQPWEQKASDKPTMPPSRQKTLSNIT
ncbi:transposable element Tcb2 transposase [Trichonephila clavipes]|nr:transposable element Tcb2 transposase [Trichonephila clavipes]